MTDKLYYKNPYIKEFIANIVKITEKNNKFNVELNQTAFFPEGGGQPWDLGYIDDIPVSYVFEENGTIYHVLDSLPSKLENVKCVLNWEKRFDHMQQHLGQHILSAAFEKLHDAETVGFHLGSEYVTIDLNTTLSPDDIKNVEYFANQIIFNNLAVKAIYPSQEELQHLPLRKYPKMTEQIRVIKIDDFDYSPCCGTHPNKTGEVGLIKIKKWENYKNGIRIEFICGNRALQDYIWKNETINKASSILSVKDNEVLEGIERINSELVYLKKQNKMLREQILDYEAKELLQSAIKINGVKFVKKIFNDRDFGEVKLLSIRLANNDKTVVLFGITNKNKAQLILSRSNELDMINMMEVFKGAIEIIDGKGGGNTSSVQGGGKDVDKINLAIEYAYNTIKKIL